VIRFRTGHRAKPITGASQDAQQFGSGDTDLTDVGADMGAPVQICRNGGRSAR